MITQILIGKVFSLTLFLFGLSYFFQAARWAAVVTRAREHGGSALVIAGFLLPWGLLIVNTHNVWVFDIPVILTVAGWAMVVKGAFAFFFPRQLFAFVPTDRAALQRMIQGGGIAWVILGGLLVYHYYFRIASGGHA